MPELINAECGNSKRLTCAAACIDEVSCRMFLLAAALRFLSVAGVTEVIFTASEPARKKPVATSKRKLGGAIRQLHVVAPCTPPELAVIVREGDA